MRKLFLSMVIAAALFTTSAKAETIRCTAITAIPFVITLPGVYCLKKNLGSADPLTDAIKIKASSVTVDLNGFVLNGLGAGAATNATGIDALNRRNITIRNGTISGFAFGVFLRQVTKGSSGHLVEDLFLDRNRVVGIVVDGSGSGIRNNRVVNTGPSDSTTAVGIAVDAARNTLIADNVVAGCVCCGPGPAAFKAALKAAYKSLSLIPMVASWMVASWTFDFRQVAI